MINNALAHSLFMLPRRWADENAYEHMLTSICKFSYEMHKSNNHKNFKKLARKYGEKVTAIVLANTLLYNTRKLDHWNIEWAMDVLNCSPYSNCVLPVLEADGIREYAVDFIKKHSAN